MKFLDAVSRSLTVIVDNSWLNFLDLICNLFVRKMIQSLEVRSCFFSCRLSNHFLRSYRWFQSSYYLPRAAHKQLSLQFFKQVSNLVAAPIGCRLELWRYRKSLVPSVASFYWFENHVDLTHLGSCGFEKVQPRRYLSTLRIAVCYSSQSDWFWDCCYSLVLLSWVDFFVASFWRLMPSA